MNKPRKRAKKNTIVQSMQLAAGRLKIEVSEVKRAKRGGSEAFDAAGRINLSKLEKWLNENPPSEFDNMPNVMIEEALKMRADRQRSELKALEAAGEVIPRDQPFKVFAVVAKLFVSRIYALEDRLALMYKIPKEDLRRELDEVLKPLDATQYEKLLREAGRSNS